MMVIFDIPENERHKRSHLRALLHELGFKKIQQSVWVSDNECREYLAAEIKNFGLESYVEAYESFRIEV